MRTTRRGRDAPSRGRGHRVGEREPSSIGLLAQNLARALDTFGAWVDGVRRVDGAPPRPGVLVGGEWIEDFEYAIAGTPCETAIKEAGSSTSPDRSSSLYPGRASAGFSDSRSRQLPRGAAPAPTARCHRATWRWSTAPHARGEEAGPAVRDLRRTAPSAEMRRLRLEDELRERQEKLGATDRQRHGRHRRAGRGPARHADEPRRREGRSADGGARLRRRARSACSGPATRKLAAYVEELEQRGPAASDRMWIPGGLAAEPPAARPFPAEATLSRFEMRGRPFYTLILRNVDERIEAERTHPVAERRNRIPAPGDRGRPRLRRDRGPEAPRLRAAFRAWPRSRPPTRRC